MAHNPERRVPDAGGQHMTGKLLGGVRPAEPASEPAQR